MNSGQANIVFGWWWVFGGLLFGMLLGLRSEGESWFGGYASLTRRYLRLAHVAFIALSIINILYGLQLASIPLTAQVKNIGSALMIFGAAGVPIACITAAFFRKARLLLPLPATAIVVGVIIMAIGAARL